MEGASLDDLASTTIESFLAKPDESIYTDNTITNDDTNNEQSHTPSEPLSGTDEHESDEEYIEKQKVYRRKLKKMKKKRPDLYKASASINVVYERHRFFSTKWERRESASGFYEKLFTASKGCEFLEPDGIIRDMMLLNMTSKKLQKKLLNNPQLTLGMLLLELGVIVNDDHLEFADMKVEIKKENEIDENDENMDSCNRAEKKRKRKAAVVVDDTNDSDSQNNNDENFLQGLLTKNEQFDIKIEDTNFDFSGTWDNANKTSDDDEFLDNSELLRAQFDDLKPTIPCRHCEESFASTKMLRRHWADAHKEIYTKQRPHACQLCDRRFAKRTHLLKHTMSHTSDTPETSMECDQCLKTFTRKDALVRHRLRHSNVRSHACEVCGKMFATEFNLKLHSLKHEKNGSRKRCSALIPNGFLCDLCGRSMNSNKALKNHMHSHSGARPFDCEKCSKSFRSRTHLRSHMKTHTSERPHKCRYCDKTFLHNSYVKVHERTHTGLKPYKCDFCERSFSDHKAFRNHRRLHTGECPYKCNLCDKSFPQLTGLKSHQRTHARHFIKQEPVSGLKKESALSFRLSDERRLARLHSFSAMMHHTPLDTKF